MVAIFMLSVYNGIYASEMEAESRISRVTVYPDTALVNRRADLKLNLGSRR